MNYAGKTISIVTSNNARELESLVNDYLQRCANHDYYRVLDMQYQSCDGEYSVMFVIEKE